MADELTPYQKAMRNFAGDEEPVTFDLGFTNTEVPDTETMLGQQAINVEDLQQSIQDQIEKYLATAQTNAVMMQNAINGKLFEQMTAAKDNVRGIQQSLETQLAMRMGQAFEQANQLLPYDSVIQTVMGNATQPDPEWTAAAQRAQAAMAASSIGTSPTPPGAIPPPIIPPPSPQPPAQPPTTPIAPLPAMTPQEFNDWLCANYSSLVPPVYAPGMPFAIEITRIINSDGSFTIIYWWFVGDVTTGIPKTGSVAGLMAAGPNGVSGIGKPNCTTNPPPIPPIIPPYPPPPDRVCPPQIPCPPVKPCEPCPPPKEPPCIKLCKDDTDCEETEYEVYCSEGGVTYLVKKGEPPRSGSDKRVASGPGSGLNLASILKECRSKDDPSQPSPSGPGPLVFSPVSGCGGLVQSIGINAPNDGKWIESLLNLKIAAPGAEANTGDNVIDALAKWFVRNVIPGTTASLDNIIEGVVRWLSSTGCASGTAYATVAGRAIAGLASRLLGRATDPVETTLEYAYNSQCAYKLPSSEAATRAFLTNSIDLDRLICLVQANGDRWDTWSQLVDSARTRLNAQETLVGWRRKIIDPEWADENLRQLGYLPGPETEILKQLTEQLPTMADLIPMMIRDVADEVNIDWRDSDDTFNDKFTGPVKDWAEKQGIPQEVFKYAWRAHWTLPSPTQLFEFFHRLRHKPEYGGPQAFRERIRRTLIQQDILPQWVDEYLQVSFRPLTRVDTRRAYEIGAIDEAEVTESYIDQGYSDENAQRLTRFAKAQQIERAKKSPLVRRYASGELTFDDLHLELEESGFSEEMIEIATSKAQRELRYRRRKTCLAAMKKRYLLGEYKFPEIRDKIQSEGIDPTQAEEIAKGWECEKQRRGKAVPAQTLCEWYTLGVISEVEMYTRLLNLGYEQDDAAKLSNACRARLGLKLQKDQQKAIADANRRAKQEAAAAVAAGKQLEREVEKVATANRKRSATKQRRQKYLIEAAEKYSDRLFLPISDAAIGIQSAIDAAVAAGLADTDTVYQTAIVVADNPECDSMSCFSRLLGDLLIQVSGVPSI